jgi:hypothetical protein
MLGQAVYLLVLPATAQRLQCRHNLGMQHPSPLLEQTVIGHVMGQSVFERVDAFGKKSGLVEKLSSL